MRWMPTTIDPAKPKLYLDLVPQTSWCSNLRSALPKADWDVLRKAAYRYANWNCLICGGRGPKHPLDAHERWHYRDGVQKLIGIDGICPACHGVCHFGFSCVQGKEYEAYGHLMKVNYWTHAKAQEHVDASFDEWEQRSESRWRLDVSLLKEMQVPLSPEGEKMLVHDSGFWTFADALESERTIAESLRKAEEKRAQMKRNATASTPQPRKKLYTPPVQLNLF